MATNQPDGEQTQTLDQTLQKTTLGDWIAKHKNLVIGFLIAAFLGSAGYGVYRSQAKRSRAKDLNTIFGFQEVLTKKDVIFTDALKAMQALPEEIRVKPIFLESLLVISNMAKSQEEMKSLLPYLSAAFAKFNKSNLETTLMGIQLAAYYENLGEVGQAISVYEELVKSKNKVAIEKTYLDLGRLYQKQGNTDQAKKSFKHIIDEHPNHELAKLAQLYLDRLK